MYLQLLDIGIVNAQAELIEFILNILNHFCLEDLPFLEDLLHRHARDNHTGLSLDDALDDVLHVVALRRHDGGALGERIAPVGTTAEQEGILAERFGIVVGSDGEDGRKGKLKLLHRHGLQVEGKVKGRDGDAGDALPWLDEGLFDDADVADVAAGDDEVFVCLGNVVPHLSCRIKGMKT